MLDIVRNELRSSITKLESVKTKAMVLRVLNGIILILKRINIVPVSSLNLNNYLDLENYYLSNTVVDITSEEYLKINQIFHNLNTFEEAISVKELRDTLNLIISTLKLHPNIASLSEDFNLLRYHMLYQINSGTQFTFVKYSPPIKTNLFSEKVSQLNEFWTSSINSRDLIIEINKLVYLLKNLPGIVSLEDFDNLRIQFLEEKDIILDYGDASRITLEKEEYGNALSYLNSPTPL